MISLYFTSNDQFIRNVDLLRNYGIIGIFVWNTAIDKLLLTAS